MNQKTELIAQLTQYFANQHTTHHFAPQLYAQFAQSHANGDWYLLGTDGCHLCDDVDNFLHSVTIRLDLPTIHRLELLDFLPICDSKLLECLSPFIPILLTPHDFLCYPFGIMDILSLKNNSKNQ